MECWLAKMLREPAFVTRQLREVPLQPVTSWPASLPTEGLPRCKIPLDGGCPLSWSVQLTSKCCVFLLPHCQWHFSGISAPLPGQSDLLKHPAAFHRLFFTRRAQSIGRRHRRGTSSGQDACTRGVHLLQGQSW